MRRAVGLDPVPGLLVRAVEDGGAAAAAGLREGDVLVPAGTRELRSVGALHAALDEAGERGRVRVTVLRGSAEKRVELRVGATS